MIANEYSPLTQTPTLSVQKGKTLQLIYKAMNELLSCTTCASLN